MTRRAKREIDELRDIKAIALNMALDEETLAQFVAECNSRDLPPMAIFEIYYADLFEVLDLPQKYQEKGEV